jgi:hypothetical protein
MKRIRSRSRNPFACLSGGGGFYPTTIDQSLRFNDNDSAYLSWTPASAGNRKTWTWSGWVKRGNLVNGGMLFSAGSSTTNTTHFYFRENNYLDLVVRLSGANVTRLITNAVFRDPSAWYHVVLSVDTTQATASDRYKIYVNGVDQANSGYSTETYASQNTDDTVNNTSIHYIGYFYNGIPLDGYLAEVHFCDGTAYTADDFGELKSGIWVAKSPSVTYGTNGFHLPFAHDTQVEGFNTVLYTGNGSTQSITGLGFEPDLVWIKNRDATNSHNIRDSIRGANKVLLSNSTSAELDNTGYLTSFDSDGFSLALNGGDTNASGNSYVAWCWDAGSGSPVSNTDGSITSTVKANPDYGFSVVSYTANGSANQTIGHGLSSAPEMVIVKSRDSTLSWGVWFTGFTADNYIELNNTNAKLTFSTVWNTVPTATTFGIGNTGTIVNNGTQDFIAYCFHSVAGYSSFGSYTGTGATGNSVTTGFSPAFVMIKRTDNTGTWLMYDNVRDTANPRSYYLYANLSNAEAGPDDLVQFDSNGFTLLGGNADWNASGGTYIYMAFADTREAVFWGDESGNNNTWQPNNLAATDVVLDSPTNNFATFNAVSTTAVGTLQEGNLESNNTASNWAIRRSSIAPTTGKWYCEFCLTSASNDIEFGIVDVSTLGTTLRPSSGQTSLYALRGSNIDRIYLDGVEQPSLGSPDFADAGNIVSMAYDIDAGAVDFYVNGTLRVSTTMSDFDPVVQLALYSTSSAVINFGQDSSFAGNKTPQGYTDANGLGDFYYAPPTGALALCTANLPAPVFDPANDVTPEDHFNTVLWTGNGSTQSIDVGFQPDLVWAKSRSAAYNNRMFNVISGATSYLYPDSTNAEATAPNQLLSFDSDGFSIGNSAGINENTKTYVAWCFKAGGTPVSNTDGTITSSVSANVDAGFSIVSWTSAGSGTTVGHGLSQAPDLIITKARSAVTNWLVYHSELGGPYSLNLNLTDATSTSSTAWNNTYPDSSVFTTGSFFSSTDYIAYCWHSVEGFSKFGSYTGNGSADGPFVYTGFKPAFVMVKRTNSTGHWVIHDNARDAFNVASHALFANDSGTEASQTDTTIDMLSNGFKIKNSNSNWNASGGTYIFMAFAEDPFKYSDAR